MAREIKTTFAGKYHKNISLEEALLSDIIRAYAAQSTWKKIPHNSSQGLTNKLAEQRHHHSLSAKALHWFFVILFGYGVYKKIENKEQLNDLELLKSEIFFALIFLIFILFRFIYMKKSYNSALPSNTPKIQLIAAKFVRISMYFVLSGIAATGLGIGFLYWLGYKNGLFLEIIIWLHELLFSTVVWLISIHILAAIYHRTQNDFVWSSMVPFLKENEK